MLFEKFTFERALHLCALIIAVGVRFIELGTVPLTETEASLAVQAWVMAQNGDVVLNTSPGYALATGLLFQLGSSAALARFLPASAGALLAVLPYMFRKRIGRLPALILAFAFALDPGLVAVSRQAGGLMLAVAFGGAALAAWDARRGTAAGIFAGLAILSGPSIFGGVLGVAAAAGLARLLGISVGEGDAVKIAREEVSTAHELRSGILSGGGTLLLAGTLFLRYPQGIAALTAAIPEFIGGWIFFSEIPLLRQILALLVYHPLPLLFGLLGTIRAWRDGKPVGKLLSLWAGSALLFALVYPSRQVSDLVWAVLPLWTLAAIELGRYLRWPVPEAGAAGGEGQISIRGFMEERWTAIALGALLFVFLSYVWLNLLSLARLPADPELTVLRWVLIVGAVLLGVLASGLIAFGWGRSIASHGLVWGVSTAFGFYMLAGTWQSVEPQAHRAQELWWQQPITVGESMLLETVYDVSEWQTGRRTAIPITILVDRSSLRWTFRNFPEARFVERLAGDKLPELVITATDTEPRLAASYRGTDIGWTAEPAWPGAAPPDLLSWLVFRDAPETTDDIILWARNDLFLDGELEEVEEEPSAWQKTINARRQLAENLVQQAR